MPYVEAIRAPLHESIERRLAADGTPGLALAITDREGTIHTTAYGSANLDAKTAVTDETLFEIGSIGKTFTAIALLHLQEEGQIDLQAPVTEYLPWFSIRSAYDPIRLHHLLCHTAGISSGADFTNESVFQVWSLREQETSSAPGTRFHYSNLGYKILGVVLERVANASYGEIIQRRILDPLGMTDSYPTIFHAMRQRLAVGYSPLFDDRPWLPHHPLVPATWLESDTADGSLSMTARDLATFLRMLLNRGGYPGGRLLSPASFDLLIHPAATMNGDNNPNFHGYGVMSWHNDGHLYIGHGGSMVGYFAGMFGDLDAGLGAVALVNGPGSPGRIALRALAFAHAAYENNPPPAESEDDAADLDDYAGTYRGPSGSIAFRVEGDALVLDAGADSTPLVPFGDGAFVADVPRWNRSPFRFWRRDGQVVEVSHGAAWGVNDRFAGPVDVPLPEEWRPYPGRYHSYNPWLPGFVVVDRNGRLFLDMIAGADGFAEDQPLVPLADGSFRAGEDAGNPERLRFDTIIEGKAIRAILSGGDYHRVGEVEISDWSIA